MNCRKNTLIKFLSLSIFLLLILSNESYAGFKYSQARFYQVTGAVNLASVNQQIMWGQIDGTTTTFVGGWGVSSLSFNMLNSDNANVSKAKLWYNTVNDFSTATLMDSVSNPIGTISFNVNGVSDLGLVSIYFFLTYDIAATGCNGNVLDASIPANGITVIGNVAGLKSPLSGSNPSGNRTISTTPYAPAISIIPSTSSVAPGGSVIFTPNPTNGGVNPSYAWYINGIFTTTTNGVYNLTNITATTTVYCIMTSNLPCVSPITATSVTKTISVGGYKYSASTFYQTSGNVLWGAKNQQILYGKFDGATSSSSGGWGVSSLSFTTANTDNANVTKAKLWYNTTNDFSTAVLKDSITNPSGTIVFNIPGVSGLELTSVYFFLTYDVAITANCGNTIDAFLPTNAITINGNIAGQKSVTTGTNPSGNRTIGTAFFTPAVTVVTSSSSVVPGGSVTLTPTPVNGGLNPSYDWYVNGVFNASTGGPLTLTNITTTSTVYCIMTSNLLCASPLTATSANKTITVKGYKYSKSAFFQIVGTVAPGSKNNQMLYGKFDGATSNNSGGWGVSALSFNMTSFNQANVAKAKLWYNTTNDFTTAILKDSISNPTGKITFNIGGVSNLGLASVYFFLTYDMATSGVCNSNIVDASVATNGITIIGNIAGQKSASTGSNPVGYLTVSTLTTPASVGISASSSSVVSGGSVVFTPAPVNGGSNPTYNWFVNGVLTATTNGTYTLTNVTAETSVYCKMTSNLACSNAQVSSQTLTITVTIAGYQYASSTFYQVAGSVFPGATNQQILYGKLDGAPSSSFGGWGVSELSFTMSNSINANVAAAKLFYNTVNDFSTAVLKDSIAHPFGTIKFNISGISNLGLVSAYFFLVYDIEASGPCDGNVLDAFVPVNGITIIENGAGQKSVTNDPNPSGSRSIVATQIVPSVSIIENTNNIIPGNSVTLTPTAINGGINPSYAWYVNGLYMATTFGSYTTQALPANTTIYCVMTSDLPCAFPQAVNSAPISIVVQGYQYSSSTFYQIPGTFGSGNINQPIMYGKFDGVASSQPGGWGVSNLSFTMANTNNSNVTAAKLWYADQNNFSLATQLDSIANPSGTINFSFSGVNNLDTNAVYFFLTFDIAEDGVCEGNTFDAFVPFNGITVNGNLAGLYSVTNDPDPAGNSDVRASIILPMVSIQSNKSLVTNGSTAVFTPTPINGGLFPSYAWYVNSAYTATTSGPFTLTNITSTVNVYCIMTSDIVCISEPTANSNSLSVSITNAKYYQSKFYQVTGTVNPGSKNQQILWGQFDGGATNYTGGWGVSQLKFKMENSSNSAVIAAKLYFNTTNNFSTAILKDSIANPSGTITFNLNGITNLDLDSYYFFLAYDISPSICVGNTFDASIPNSAITVIGNVAGTKTPVTGTNPSGNRSFSGVPLVPSVSLTTSGTTACLGNAVTFTPNPINGGTNPTYQWFVNNVSAGSTTGDFIAANLSDQSKVYCVMTSNLACVSAATATSATKTITVNSFINSVTISGATTVTEGATTTFSATVLNGGTAPTYQWYKNGIAISGETKSTMFTNFPVSGDKITCQVATNKSCSMPFVATSNELTINTIKKGRSAAILDFSSRNGELYENNLFSAKHILDVAGVPYIVSSNFELVQNYSMVLCTSWLDSIALNNYEDSIMKNYVKNGGVVIFPRFKNSELGDVFGVSTFFSSTTRYKMSWNMGSNDPSLRWLDDTLEQKISLGRDENQSIFDTRSYTLTTASALAFYEDGKVAITKNHFGNGYAYALGISLKDLILRPQLNLDYNAQRTFSNSFEPSSDVFILWIKALYAQFVPNAVWKHTSPGNTKATIMMTHDIDASTSCVLMPSVADYEDSLNIRATYFITTHYIHDFSGGDFWTDYTAQRQYLLSKNQVIASHSVGHFLDMDIESIVAIGAVGNTVTNYLPHYNGNFTTGASVYGEVEVSKYLIDTELGIDIRSYRPGYLYQHNQQINAMKDLGYEYSSSMSGNDVLTSFPYLAHKDMIFEGDLTDIYEIPLSISDAQVSDKVDSSNYTRHVANWLYCLEKNTANGAPTNLLIHPTRNFKVWAERLFVSLLPNGLTFRDVDSFGDYWKMRDAMRFSSTTDAFNNLTIVIPSSNLPLSSDFSFVVDNGQDIASISVKDENGNTIDMEQEAWQDNGTILYLEQTEEIAARKPFVSGKPIAPKTQQNAIAEIYTHCYPNPFNRETNIVYLLKSDSKVTLEIFNLLGEKIKTLVNAFESEGIHQVKFEAKDVSAGIYYYNITVNGKSKLEKIVITEE